MRLQIAGDLDQALAVYGRILEAHPGHADALHLSGVAMRRRGDPEAALRRIGASVALVPDFAEALANLANLRRDLGQMETAAATFCRAIRLKPTLAEAHLGLAAALRALGRGDDSLAALRAGAAARPDHAELGNGLGNALQEVGAADAADAAYRAALCADPAHVSAWTNRGTVLRGLARIADSMACLRRALRIAPAFPAALDGVGQALLHQDRPAEAAALHARAVAAQPGFAGAQANLGNALLALNRVDAAVAAYRRAIALDPALPDPHRNLGIALLLRGDLAEAWPEYEWRLRCADSPSPAVPRPRWDGRLLEGRTILLHAEQGLGDALHFARYVPLVAARGGRVVLCAPSPLERLLAPLPGVVRFAPAGTPLSLAGIDVHAPLLSLPLAFGTTPADIPATVPYLAPDPALAAAWGARLDGRLGPRRPDALRVGLAWAGSAGHGNDRNRSLPLDAVLPLARIPGVRLVSVQKGPPADRLAARIAAGEVPGAGAAGVLDLAPEIGDFADTAAIMMNLDLVISVDTSVVHLAGALGVPAWVLLPFAPDWRWMLHRSDNPWYPTLRLFRQPAPGAWEPVLAEVTRRLHSLMGN